MPLKFAQRTEAEAPTPSSTGKVNEDLLAIKTEMMKLASGMVLEIDAGSEKAVRSTKTLVTKAGGQLGTQWRHWNIGTKVFAKPTDAVKRRGRRPKTE